MSPDELRRIIEASGLSARRFAYLVLARDERTLRRWLSGEIEIPALAAEWLASLESVRLTRDRARIVIRLP